MLSNDSVVSLQQILSDDGLDLSLEEAKSVGELLVNMGLQLNMKIKNENEDSKSKRI